MVRVIRQGPLVAARIWLCDHEPGEAENLMDRPYVQGQIGLDLMPPLEIWHIVEFAESSPEQRRLLIDPPLSDRVPRNGRAPAYTTAPLAKWKRERAHRITLEQYLVETEWLAWASKNNPTHPDFLYRRPVDLRATPIPKFGANAA